MGSDGVIKRITGAWRSGKDRPPKPPQDPNAIRDARKRSSPMHRLLQRAWKSAEDSSLGLLSLITGTDPDAEEHEEEGGETVVPAPSIAMVAMLDPIYPDESRISQAFQISWPDGPAVSQITRNKNVFHIRLGAITAVVGFVPHAIAQEDLKPVYDLAWHWPEVEEALQYHRAHLMVGLESVGEDRIVTAMALTKVCAALAMAHDAIAVYWESAPVIQPGPFFVECSGVMTRENLPVALWVNFGFCPEPDGSVSLVTSGMRSLGFMEIEIPKSGQGHETLYQTAYHIAMHLLASGPVVADGALLGQPGDGGVQVAYSPSMVSTGQTVYRLSYV